MERGYATDAGAGGVGRNDGAMDWEAFADVYAFVGNSLLTPMARTSDVGLSPSFWSAFPFAEWPEAQDALKRLAAFAKAASAKDHAQAVQDCSVEFTRLFVGPPKPAAPPWETFYRADGVTAGFGQATFAMRQRLRDAGLELRNENNQYEDHMGIELLYLSWMCRQVLEGGGSVQASDARSFALAHPLAWIGRFRDAVGKASPDGYFHALVDLASCLLEAQVSRLSPKAEM